MALTDLTDAELEGEIQALDAEIAKMRALKKERVQILAARGAEAHQERMARGNVITPTALVAPAEAPAPAAPPAPVAPSAQG